MSRTSPFLRAGSPGDSAAAFQIWSSLTLCATLLWLTFPLVTLTTKCLLTEKQCTRWGPAEGAKFNHPVTAAALHLLITGTLLLILNMFFRAWAYAQRFTFAMTTQRQCSQGQQTIEHLRPFGLQDRLFGCFAVGVAFGAKYIVGHYALRDTPAVVYELFHSVNIVFVAVFAYFILGETLKTWGEVGGCIGIAIGSSVMAASQTDILFQVDENGRVTNTWVLTLNVLNGTLAGIAVVLLRYTMLKFGAGKCVLVTACKMLVAAVVAIPFAIAVEGSYAVLIAMTTKQLRWLCISSGAILLYHVNLSVICYEASAPTVAVIESLRPLMAFAIIALLQKVPHKNECFWFGSIIILISSIGYELSRISFRTHHQQSNGPSDENTSNVLETTPLKHPSHYSDMSEATQLTGNISLSDSSDTVV